MPYIKRNSDGKIIGLSEDARNETGEELALGHPDMRAFLAEAKDQLLSSDSETIRVIEDIVDLLIQKKLILLTDLPQAAQQKLMGRQRIRSELNALDNLVDGEGEIL